MSYRLRSLLRWYAFVALIAVAAPAAMVVLAAGIAYVARRELLWQVLLALPGWSSLGYGLLGGLTSMTLVLALYTLSPRFAEALAESSVRTATEAVDRFGWGAMLLIGTLAAVGEEVLFRGALQPLIGVALAAALFGFSHGGWRRQMWAYAVAAAVAGLVFGHLYGYTGDLWASILAHAIHNVAAVAMVALGVLPGGEEEPIAEVNPVSRPSPRELGLAVGALPVGPANAITDVPGVLVGHCTIWADAGSLAEGRGPWRTGVTAVLPHGGNLMREKVPAAAFVLNGFMKGTGLTQVAELGVLETPVLLTGTLSTFRVADALVSWCIEQNPDLVSVNPVVLECNDGWLSDGQSRPVGEAQVRTALAAAAAGPVTQGSVGAGAGLRAFGFKAGIGTASRRAEGYTLGVLVLANFGRREQLTVLGEPAGLWLRDPEPAPVAPDPAPEPDADAGSCIILLATDAPLDARQLQRLARRACLGIAHTGGMVAHGSGEACLAFSTAWRLPAGAPPPAVALLADDDATMATLFAAAVAATEEAIYGSLFAARDADGRDGRTAPALPVEAVLARLRESGRLQPVHQPDQLVGN